MDGNIGYGFLLVRYDLRVSCRFSGGHRVRRQFILFRLL